MKHLHCAFGGLAGLVLGLAVVAHAQGNPDVVAAAPSLLDSVLPPAAVALVRELGLPGVLLVLGWWARGTTLKGVPIVITLAGPLQVELSEPQLTAIRRTVRRALHSEDTEPDSDEPEVKP